MNPRNFFAELKRRNVYKVAVAYAVVGWLVMQVAATVVPALHLPDGLTTAVVVLTLLGFPIALIIAWAFEMTPEGMKRTENVSPNQTTPQWSTRKFAFFTATLAVIAAGLFAFRFLQPKAARTGVLPSASAPTGTAVSNAIAEKSVAVLPFANRSEDKSNAYFAEGIQDEILTRLAKISALKVISRTSTAHYASAPTDLRAIARQLGVANILEGSVQKVGDQVRISVQLIQASTDTHLWAETYDRKLTDIFGVESEVAKAIADALQARLTGNEQEELALKPTDNAEAYDAYLHGLAAETRSFSSLETAARFYAQATKLDPNFALAWARLSRVDARLVFALWDTSPARRTASTQALERAVALRPDATDTLLAQAYHRFYLQRDYAGAKRMFEKLRARLPSSSDVPFALSLIARRQGLWDQSLVYSDQAIALDPRDTVLLLDRARLYSNLRRYAEAIKTLDQRLEFVPGDPETIAAQAGYYQQQGQLDEARRLLRRLPSDKAISFVTNAKIAQSLLEHDYPKAVELLTEAVANAESPATSYAAAHHFFLSFAQKQTGDAAAAEATNRRARRELEALRESQPDNVRYASQLALIYAALGEKALARKEGERAVALLPAARDAVQGPPCEEMLAAVEAQVGESSRAMERLERLLSINYSGRNGPITKALLRLDPIWDPLRGDPRFQQLIAEGEAPKLVPKP